MMQHASRQKLEMGNGYETPVRMYAKPDPNSSSTSNSSSCTGSTPEISKEHIADVDNRLSWIPRPPSEPYNASITLQKPILIPQFSIPSLLHPINPFIRAYPPVLQNYFITPEIFLSFIDNLTIAMAPPPPLQFLQVASIGMGLVPGAQAAGLVVGIASGAGSAAVSRARTKRYLEVVNRELLGVRKLKVSIVKDKDIDQILGRDIGVLPRSQSNAQTLRNRRIEALRPFTAELSFDVPPPVEQDKFFNKVSAKQVKSKIAKRERKEVKEEEKLSRERGEHLQNEGQDINEKSEKPDSKASKLENKEVKKVGKMKWILIENA
ncbi:hypothetical protein FKW77_004059 [Venturia effusa]|uniref:Uncharacterized protein n=1 Tax=Venturia effusa TaxID=50376 RepID=A0A517LNR9_9PEZI|nr:hypothetical protein FKW77_004059 [Venturia effusa]